MINVQSNNVYSHRILLVELRDVLVEALALDRGDLKLKRGWLPRTVASGESASTPGRTAVNF